MREPAANPASSPAVVRATAGLIALVRDAVAASGPTVHDCLVHRDLLWLADLDGVVPRPQARPDGLLLELPYQRPGDPAAADADPATPAPAAAGREGGGPAGDGPGGPADGGEPAEDDGRTAGALAPTIGRTLPPGALPGQRTAARRGEPGPVAELYNTLARMARKAVAQDDVYELVLGVGLLTHRTADGEVIRRHLLTRPAWIQVDPASAAITVGLFAGTAAVTEDADFLAHLPGFDAEAGRRTAAALDASSGHPLGEDVLELLRAWYPLPGTEHRLTERGPAEPAPPSGDHPAGDGTGAPLLTLSPALILRERRGTESVAFHGGLHRALTAPGAVAPLGLAQLVTSVDESTAAAWTTASGRRVTPALDGVAGSADGPLLPLPTNAEQRTVAARLATEHSVVVQGPPGTGKTHTIANVLSALLAEGNRVLVTARKSHSLKVLRDKLPEPIRELCVVLADDHHAGDDPVASGLAALADRVAASNPDLIRQHIAALRGRRQAFLQRRSEALRGLLAIREAETTDRGEVAPGYRGVLADVVEAVEARRAELGWMPPLPEYGGEPAPDAPPLTAADAARLRALLRDPMLSGNAAAGRLPEPGDLPDPDEVAAAMIRAGSEDSAELRFPAGTPESMANLEARTAAELRALVDRAENAFGALGLPRRLTRWPLTDWRHRALSDLLAGARLPLWRQVITGADLAEEALGELRSLHPLDVSVPELSAADVAQYTRAGERLRDHLAAGGTLRRWLAPGAQREAERLLATCTVDGHPPRTPEQVDAVLVMLRLDLQVRALADRWERVGFPATPSEEATGGEVPPSAGAARMYAQLTTIAARSAQLRHLRAAVDARDAADRLLASHGVRLALDTPDDWEAFTERLEVLERRIDAGRAQAWLRAAEDGIRRLSPGAQLGMELEAARTSLRQRDIAGYRWALDSLRTARRTQLERGQRDELLRTLRRGHPALARELEETAEQPVWEERLAQWEAAWSWGRALAFVERHRAPRAESRLQGELDALDQQVRQVTAELAAEQAWLDCLRRMTVEQRQSLQEFRIHAEAARRETGERAAHSRRAAREALRGAVGAVPAWVMPVAQVARTLPARPDSFDVVIVDEASQAGLESLFVLGLAPRAVVVGDDRQCVPRQALFRDRGEFHDRLEERLAGVPREVRELFRPTANLYEVVSARSEAVRLREHFRCMPEIIAWSSAEFYDDSLVPLRQFGTDRLDPLRVERVRGGRVVGRDATFRNPVEAEAIVNQLARMIDDPAYRGRTFGVVVLAGSGQVRLLDELITQRIDPAVRERRQIRVGTPPDFQGDERDVVLLSTVVVEPRRVQGMAAWERRAYNVAASRARDQMWLFTSIRDGALADNDLRTSLITYMQDPPGAAAPADDDLGEVLPDQPHPRFDSLLEQRVYVRLRERGYRVVPQYPVGGRRLDLVVIGSQGRLAVECDSRSPIGGAEQIRQELEWEQDLRRTGWQFWRIRESTYLFDPEAALAGLWDALAGRGIDPVGAQVWRTARSRWTPGRQAASSAPTLLGPPPHDPSAHPAYPSGPSTAPSGGGAGAPTPTRSDLEELDLLDAEDIDDPDLRPDDDLDAYEP
ncbi:AAA domain-containing protein [Allostreptomyces psammosilenae]|uniref:AAA+ ATPase domain-containing protein n=1 Tax=Allostreptomyces psammosilenae TaxID=1892865 RepID=A0A852ZNY8_9ACTN|nr:AAA domain-containing protein [Allostreptomyces psammosilenae]NYI03415.1 hypothetical protein [Allostreptomyces psammosilenae]